MKFIFDNNLSPHLARGLRELAAGATDSAVDIIHLREKFPANTADEIWINALAKEGDWCVISQDGFRKNDVEKQAIKESGLLVFFLVKQWSQSKYWDKAQNMVRWWPIIESYSKSASGGEVITIPWRISSRLKKLKI